MKGTGVISTRFSGTNRSLTFVLVGIVVLMSILSPRRFLTVGNVISMGYQLPIIAFLSVGMMVTMLSGGINLAIVATANFTGIITALLLKALAGTATTRSSASALSSLRWAEGSLRR